DMIRPGAADLEGYVVPAQEELCVLAAVRQSALNDVELDAAVPALLEQVAGQPRKIGIRGLDPTPQVRQRGLTTSKVDRSTVVWVDEIQLPEFGALVELGNAGSGQSQNCLGQRVVQAQLGDPGLERAEVVEKLVSLRLVQDPGDEVANSLVVLGTGIDPAHVDLGLTERLVHVTLDALDERVALSGV